MKIKELKRTVNVCWSPAEHYPVMLAAGSAAQQVDSSFSSTSHLELYTLNLDDPGYDLERKSSLQTEHKFQKIVWSGAGIIVGGCDGGLIEFYNEDKLLTSSSDALVASTTKHSGHVSALDVNPYQKNLLASGASESEIFIWDLNNTTQPMAPGNRNQPYDHVQGLAWNQQVQHILGSTFSTRCVVWDLRKNEPIMKLSDSQSRTRWRSLAWHPSVATQLCIASEDDQVPVVQLWDLRLAASPLVTLEGHQKGVMSVSWSKQDPDLLLSAGKDGRILCWNPNNTKPGGELLAELSAQQQWVFEVSWSPRDPALLVAAAVDQHVAVHSLLGGSRPETNSQSAVGLMDSFGGLDSFSQLPAVSRASQPAAAARPLPAPPRWLRAPVGASFGFGGKLVTFEKCPQDAGPQKFVHISQVVSEPEIIERASELDAVLSSSLSQDPAAVDRLAEYCRERGDAAVDQNERYTWFFLRANFLPTFRTEVLNLLGFKQDEIPCKFKNLSSVYAPADLADQSVPAPASSNVGALSRDAHTLIERKLANIEITPTVSNVAIPNGEDATSLICRALVCGNLEEAVELSLDAGRVADAMLIASLGSQDLVEKVQKYHLNATASEPVSLLAGSLLLERWHALVEGSAASSWRDVLAALVTHCEGDQLALYAEMLGNKLAKETEPSLSEAATICYLCAMSPEALVERWAGSSLTGSALAGSALAGSALAGSARAGSLLRLTELALLARRAAAVRGRQVQAGGQVEAVVNAFATRLAAQGRLRGALAALEGVQRAELRERLLRALAHPSHAQPQRRASQQVQQPQMFGGRVRTTSGHSQKRGHVLAHNDVSNTYSAVAAATPAYEAHSWQQASVPAPLQTSYQRGGFLLQSQPQPQSLMQPQLQPHLQPQQQPPTALPPQPPRPGSVGPQGGGLPGRKYKVDPSVQSAPLYNQYNFNNPAVTQQPYGYNSPLPDQYSSASVPQANTFTPIQQNTLNPLGQNPAGQMNPAMNGGYYTPQQPAEVGVPAPSKPAPAGWNDPPTMTSKPKPKQEHTAQAPITHPLFGVEPQHVPLVPAAGAAPQQYTQQYGQQYDQQYAQYEQQQYQQFPPAGAPGYQQQVESPAPPPPVVEPVPVQKAPIPEEHQIVQTVLDSLRIECSNRAVNPQMKRKLEEVQKRLETLYDMLRENRLSPQAVAALLQCAALARRGAGEGARAAAAALASGADFAAVASFLPALKVLLQLAAQLQLLP